ncbi:MAG: DUF924 family protein [Paracoccaceae bacterium]
MHTEIDDILTFWLDEVGAAQWYNPPDGLDDLMRARFTEACVSARARKLDYWAATAPGALALLLLLDQFPRNIWRGTAEAYASDPHGLTIAKSSINRGLDLSTPEPERQFFYLPLEHSESLSDQERCLRLLLMRLPSMPEEGHRAVLGHRDVIRRFARFPSRNAILGRRDTSAELEYRALGGYMSGAPGTGPG